MYCGSTGLYTRKLDSDSHRFSLPYFLASCLGAARTSLGCCSSYFSRTIFVFRKSQARASKEKVGEDVWDSLVSHIIERLLRNR